jgi:hypothetical protein
MTILFPRLPVIEQPRREQVSLVLTLGVKASFGEIEFDPRVLESGIAELIAEEAEDLHLRSVLDRSDSTRRQFKGVGLRRATAPLVLLPAAAGTGLVASDVHGDDPAGVYRESGAGKLGGRDRRPMARLLAL